MEMNDHEFRELLDVRLFIIEYVKKLCFDAMEK